MNQNKSILPIADAPLLPRSAAYSVRLPGSSASPSPDRLRDAWYDGLFWLSFTGMTLGFSLRTEGFHHVPARGAALLIANHQSFIDPVLVGLAARRHLHYLARKTLFRHGGLAWLMRSLNGVPVDQEGFAREGLTTMLQELNAGHAVVVFPEGERTPDGRMKPFRPGIHLLIKRAEMAIVPVGIAGAFDAWPRQRAFPLPAPLFWPARPGTIAVSIGPPIASAKLRDLPREQALAELFATVKQFQERAERLRRKS
ncbi:MAG TPA: lysophospholipid acyltransferase family protein [Gemmataceae bacterium]|jgi:1-acyl-sn-glycerol-3-phosphate acyltransferase|nr:lysophospholipid acyltransferase family protein [Gemmataceae bacterium]